MRSAAAGWALCGVLLAAMAALGWRIGEDVASVDDYFLGGRRLPATAAALALVAAEVSALTVVGVPAFAFRADWTYLQLFLGAAAARALVAVLFLPAFFRAGGETPYAYLGARFGPVTRAAGAGAFLAARLSVSAVRLLAACVAAGVLLGGGPWPALAALTLLGVAALARGGVRAAVWTGAFQALALLALGALGVLVLARRADGGATAAWALASAAWKLRVFDGATLLPAFLTGFFGSLAAFGTDCELAQKLLVVRDARAGRDAMLLSIAGSLALLLLSLLTGTLLFVFYKQNPGMALPPRLDRVYPHFAASAAPGVMRGVVLAAVAIAAVDAPLASLSAAFVTDVWRPLGRAARPDGELLLARRAAVAFALLLAALAAAFAVSPRALRAAVEAGGAAAGPLLGMFLFGLTSERRGDATTAAAFAAAAAANLALALLAGGGRLGFAWGWPIPAGAAACYALAWALARPAAAAPAGARVTTAA